MGFVMAGRYYDKNTPRRRRKRGPNLMPLLLLAAAVICVAVIILLVVVLAAGPKNDPDTPTGTNVAPSTGVPTVTTTVPPTTAVPTTPGVPAEAVSLMAQTDFIAAGYDYDKAISMLESSEYYTQVPAMQQKVAEYQEAKGKLVRYPTPEKTTHVFFHSLIADTSRAFDGDSDSFGYNMYMTTIDEFLAMMEQMYEKGYVLVSPYDLAYEYTDETGTHFKYGDIYLPEGKTPFLMSQDDVNYYSYMIGTGDGKDYTPIFADTNGDGFAHKIVIGEDGYPTCEYMDKDGNIVTGDYDLVPVLERFIQEHPDFSYRGARAMLGVTGYEGVLGYRTKPTYETAMGSEAYAAEVAAAKEVVQCLKEHGWLIVSHSYGHPAYGNIDAYRVDADSNRWETTVQPIVGDTDIILYPHGSDIHTWHKYPAENAKFQALYADGYRYFFNVDSNVYWNQMGDNYFRGGRRNLDGVRMYHNPEMLTDLFDVESVFDPARPTPVNKNGPGM